MFSRLHSLFEYIAVVEEWKYGVCCFLDILRHEHVCMYVIYHNISQFLGVFRPDVSYSNSDLIIGIHRIMIHTDQIPQSCGDTYIVCVCLVSRYQIDQFYPFSVSLIIFYAGVRYKLLNQWKMSFSCGNPSWVSIQRENNENLVVFDVFIDTWCLGELGEFLSVFFRVSIVNRCSN